LQNQNKILFLGSMINYNINNLILQNILVGLFLLLFIPSGNAINIDSLQASLTSEMSEENYNTLLFLSDYFVYENPDTAYYYSHEAYKIADFIGNDNLLAKAILYDAECFYQMNKMEEAIDAYERALVILEKLGNKEKQIVLYSEIALLYYELNDFNNAIRFDTKALELSILENDISEQINAMTNIGISQIKQSKYDIALDFYLKALKLAQQNNLKDEEAKTLNSIGALYHNISNNDLAIEYFRKSLEIRKEIKDSVGMSGSYNNIGLIYKNNMQYDSAIVYYNAALKISKDILLWKYVAKNLNNIAVVHMHKGEYDKALEYSFRSINIRKEHGNSPNLIPNYLNVGNIYFEMNELQKALEYYYKSLDLAKEYHIIYSIGLIYNKIYELYAKSGNYENALENLRLYNMYQDSIMNEKMRQAILDTETKYKSEEKEIENQMLKKEKELNAKIRIYLIIVSSSIGVILILLIYFFYHKSKLLKRNRLLYRQEKQLNTTLKKTSEMEKQRLEELVFAEKKINELQEDKISVKNRELSAIALSEHNKNKMLSELVKEIELIEKQNSFGRQSLKKFRHIISGTQIIEDDWLTFKEQIEEVYNGFFAKLNKKFPSLSTYERRLSAYLLIGMTSREIAKLMNVTIYAIYKSRQRLRKKLELSDSDNFSEFLRQI